MFLQAPEKGTAMTATLKEKNLLEHAVLCFERLFLVDIFSSAQGAAQGTTIDEFQTPAAGVGHEMHQFHR